MKTIIMGKDPKTYAIQRLISEGIKRNRSPEFYSSSANHSFNLPKNNFDRLDVLMRDPGLDFDDFDLLLAQNLKCHLPCTNFYNSLDALALFRQKDRQYLYLLENKLPVIPSFFSRKIPLPQNLFHDGDEFILKLSRGMKGIGVNHIKSPDDLIKLTETLKVLGDERFIIQPYVPHTTEWRAFFIGQSVLYFFEKTRPGNLSNLKVSEVTNHAPKELIDITIAMIKNLPLYYGAIDFLQNPSGQYKIIEINSVPGFEFIEKHFSLNIAGEIYENLNFS